MGANVLQLDAKDNVLVALSDLRQGDEVSFGGHSYRLKTGVPAKHKFATQEIGKDGAVVMYGVLIGKTMEPIGVGERITTRNTHHEAAAFHEKTRDYGWHAPDVTRWRDQTFLGFHREDRQVGTRNYWLIAPLVFLREPQYSFAETSIRGRIGICAAARVSAASGR